MPWLKQVLICLFCWLVESCEGCSVLCLSYLVLKDTQHLLWPKGWEQMLQWFSFFLSPPPPTMLCITWHDLGCGWGAGLFYGLHYCTCMPQKMCVMIWLLILSSFLIFQKEDFQAPKSCHFRPDQLDTFVSVVYPANTADDKLGMKVFCILNAHLLMDILWCTSVWSFTHQMISQKHFKE